MYETNVTVIGNVLHPPQWRRTTNTRTMVTTFKIASTARRLDRESGKWVDGNSLRVRVNCWRALASNVYSSVTVGDPLIVSGRLYTRDWVDDEGIKRTQFELEATAVGHDLSRGKNRFERVKPSTATSTVEDAQSEQRVGGELTELVPDHEAPSQFEDIPYQPEEDPFDAAPVGDPGLGREPGLGGDPGLDGDPRLDGDPEAAAGRPGAIPPWQPDQPAPVEADPADAPAPVSDLPAAVEPGSGRRGSRRAPVAA